MKGLGKHWFPIALVALVLVVTLAIWRPWGSLGEDLPLRGEAADFELEHVDGTMTSLSDEAGKVRLVYFFFSHCPDICIPTTAMMSKLQEELKDRKLLGSDAIMYSISFDPDRDTTERLKKFGEAYQADFSAWKFLRGDEELIKNLAQKYNVSVFKDQAGNFIHSNIFTLVDRDGQVRQYYLAGDPEVVASGELIRQMADDIQRLAK